MLAIQETISYTSTWNEIIGICAAFIGAIVLFLIILFCIVGYGDQREYEERTMDNRPIERSALPSHYIASFTLLPEPSITNHNGATTPNPDTNSD